MNSNYLKGYRFERRVKQLLEDKGYIVFRQGKSAFPDLLVFGNDDFMMVECKYGQHPAISKEELNRFKQISEQTTAKLLIAKGKPRQPIIFEGVFPRQK